MKRRAACLILLAACSASSNHNGSAPDAPARPDGGSDSGSGGLPAPIEPADFTHALDKAYIRAPQTWIGDGAFDVKWASMLTAPIELLGGASSAYHADLASRAVPLPGGEVLCHGDPKLDNFGWVDQQGGVFSNIDFDDAGACPAAADILHLLVATELEFSDAALDDQALAAYITTLINGSPAVTADPAGEPVWAALRSTGVDKATHQDAFAIGGEVQAPTSVEIAAVTALVASDARFPTNVVDVARDVHTAGGSAGLRRFWILAEDAQHPRTIIELKELAKPGTENGPHTTTYDDAGRFDVVVPYWWGAPAPADHFAVTLFGASFLARDRFGHATPKAAKLTSAQIAMMIQAEASLLAAKHATAWTGIDPVALRPWLQTSAATLAARWRATYATAGGM